MLTRSVYANVRVGAPVYSDPTVHTVESAKAKAIGTMKAILASGRAQVVSERGYDLHRTECLEAPTFVDQVTLDTVTFTPWSHGDQKYIQGRFVFEVEEPES